MIVFDICLESAELLNQNDVVDALKIFKTEIDANENPTEFLSDVFLKCRKLMSAINLVCERICSEFVAVRFCENVVSTMDSKINLSSLSYPAHEIIKVVDNMTNEIVSVLCFPTYISVPIFGREYSITYRYRPNLIDDLLDEIELPIFVTRRAVCFGVVSDILLSRNVFDEAKIWNQKFVDSIKLVQKMVKERKF